MLHHEMSVFEKPRFHVFPHILMNPDFILKDSGSYKSHMFARVCVQLFFAIICEFKIAVLYIMIVHHYRVA